MPDTAPRIVHTADGRAAGYRRFGDGPPVALLHASPRSAAALLPLGLRLADRFTVFAFDTPGFGWSDKLAMAAPDAGDFADALLAAFDALGLERAAAYGSHTGGAIAAAAAWLAPHRVPALALDGYAMFTPTEQAEYLANYLAPLGADWHGAHLAFLWSRVKDQFTAFPWYLRADAARLPRPLPDASRLQAVVLDFLAAGDAYRPAYAAAFAFGAPAGLARLTVPTTVMARSDDLLFTHLDRVAEAPPLRVRRLGTDDAAWADAVAEALAAGAAGPAPPPPPLAASVRPGDYDVVRVGGGTIGFTRYSGPATARPVVVLPPIPGSARGEAALARGLARARPVIVVDLPGFGASALTGPHGPDRIAAAITEALAAAGVTGFDVVAAGAGAVVGTRLGHRRVLLDPVVEAAAGDVIGQFPDVTPRLDGTHLAAAWHQLRDASLWLPWFCRDPGHAIAVGHGPDVTRMQTVLTDWMRGAAEARTTLTDVLAGHLEAAVPAAAGHTAFVLRAGHPWSATSAALAARHGAAVQLVEDTSDARVAAILAALAG